MLYQRVVASFPTIKGPMAKETNDIIGVVGARVEE